MTLKKYKEIDLSKDKKILILVNLLAFGLLFAGFWIFSYLGAWIKQLPNQMSATFGMGETFIYFVASIILLLIHEGIHGFFFKFFAPDRPVKYGFHGYALSASSPESKYRKGQFIWSELAPFVLITSFLSIVLCLYWLPFLGYVFLASFHTSGCVGGLLLYLSLVEGDFRYCGGSHSTGLVFYRQKAVDDGQ